MVKRFIQKYYRQIVAISLVVASFALLATVFQNAIFSFWEALLTLGRSGWAYIRFPFYGTPYERPIRPPSGNVLPDNWSYFFTNLGLFFRTLVDGDNLRSWFEGFETFLINFMLILPVLVMVIVALRFYINHSFTGKCNTKYNKDTLPLKAFKRCLKHSYYPFKHFIVSTVKYVYNSKYARILLLIWLFNLNVFSIVLHLLAFILYFFISFDFVSLYYFLHNVVVLLIPAIQNVPLFLWIVLFLIWIDRKRKNFALRLLNHMEAMNKGFINERDICVFVHGSMGKRKTTLITDMALSTEAYFRFESYRIIFENDLKFPHFPWILFEKRLEEAIDKGKVFNLASCRKFVKQIERLFNKDLITLFDYDYKTYGLEYDDGKEIVSLFDCMSTYAEAYFIYTVKSSLIFSNYAIRTDGVMIDQGNLPDWNFDFFSRKSDSIKHLSRHSHILDEDMLRRGKKLIKNNVRSGCFEFGIINISEIGKERGNQYKEQELKAVVNEFKENKKTQETLKEKLELKKKSAKACDIKLAKIEADLLRYSERATILTDKFNLAIKMIRHSATVGHTPFVKIFFDDQREESLAADCRELCEIISIKKVHERKLAMRLYFIEDIIYNWLFPKFQELYKKYRHSRGDNTLLMYILKAAAVCIHRHHERISNRFGYHVMELSCFESAGGQTTSEGLYYLSVKKIFSSRFATDAFRDLFDKRLSECGVGIEDIPEYQCYRADIDELKFQNSYFVEEIMRYENF